VKVGLLVLKGGGVLYPIIMAAMSERMA